MKLRNVWIKYDPVEGEILIGKNNKRDGIALKPAPMIITDQVLDAAAGVLLDRGSCIVTTDRGAAVISAKKDDFVKTPPKGDRTDE